MNLNCGWGEEGGRGWNWCLPGGRGQALNKVMDISVGGQKWFTRNEREGWGGEGRVFKPQKTGNH